MTQNSSAQSQVSPFAAFNSPPASSSATPQPAFQQQSAFSPPQPAAADPFASLGGSMNKEPAAAAPPPQPTVSNDDDEWNFTSSLPPAAPSKPKQHQATISNTSVRIDFLAGRQDESSSSMKLSFAFSNNTAQPISELHFQLAVTKVRPVFTIQGPVDGLILTILNRAMNSNSPRRRDATSPPSRAAASARASRSGTPATAPRRSSRSSYGGAPPTRSARSRRARQARYLSLASHKRGGSEKGGLEG